jgi:hypothetical protein
MKLDVDDDTGSLFVLRNEEAVYQELEALERFAAWADEQAGIGRPDLENDMAVTHALLNLHMEIQVT